MGDHFAITSSINLKPVRKAKQNFVNNDINNNSDLTDLINDGETAGMNIHDQVMLRALILFRSPELRCDEHALYLHVLQLRNSRAWNPVYQTKRSLVNYIYSQVTLKTPDLDR